MHNTDQPQPVVPYRLLILFSGGTGFYGRWARRLTRSQIAHAAWGHSGWVVNNTYDGDVAHELDRYLRLCPRLRCCFHVPVATLPPLALNESDRPQTRIFLRWLSRGWLFPGANDCATSAVRALRSAGVPVPPRTVTAVALHRWLEAQGFPHDRFSPVGHVPQPSGRASAASATDPASLGAAVPGEPVPIPG